MTPSRVSESMAAAEVVVRFAETIVTTAHVARGKRFVIGQMREADLALDVPAFTLVEATARGFMVRTSAEDRAVVLAEPIEITLGHVTIRVARVTLAPTPVPRREVERRPLVFGAGSLALHATVLLVSGWLATPAASTVAANESTKRPTKIARFAVEAQTVERQPEPPPQTTPITSDSTPTPDPELAEMARAAVDAMASVEANGLGEQLFEHAIETTDSLGETEPQPGFDPDANPAFDTVKVGDFATVSTGSSAGAGYRLAGENGQRRPVIVISCDASSCLILGGDPKSGIREALESKLDQITGCYEQHGSTAGKKVELDFGIDETGKIEEVNVGGVGDYDSCVAKIIKSIEV